MIAPLSPDAGSSGPPRLLFDGFELRLDSGELFEAGSPVRLQPQPAKVLEILAGRPGEVVSREEMRQLVWGDSFLDFDASLNFCIKEIRRALGDSATLPRFIETVPKRGYRFLRPVRIEPEPGGAAPKPVLLPPQAPEPRPWSRPGAAGLTVVLLILLTFAIGSRLKPASDPRLAVLPLACRAQNPADRQICGGITEALTAELSRQFPQGLDVLAPLSAQAYGRKIQTTHLLSGEAEPSREGLRLTVRMVRTEDDAELWRESFDAELKDSPLVYTRITRRVAEALGLPAPALRTEKRPRPAAPAYEAYLRGLYLLANERYEEAQARLQDAVLHDPDFALGYAHLALARLNTSVLATDFEATEAAARRALALDPNLAEAHVALGTLRFQYHLDWDGAGRAFRKALALNPGSADAHHEYSLYLSALGRHAEGIASAARARELNPASMQIGSNYAWYFYMDHRYEEAIRQARSILELYPLSASIGPKEARMGRYMCQNTILLSAWKLGDRETALGAAREILRILGPPWAESQLRDMNEFWSGRELRIRDLLRQGPVDTYSQAKNAILLGERDRALDLLTGQCDSPGLRLPFAAIEPVFDSLHGDPRWPRVLDCLKLPAAAPARRQITSSRE